MGSLATADAPGLSTLPTEILIHIANHVVNIDANSAGHAETPSDEVRPRTLARLAQCSRALCEFVWAHGWKTWVVRRYGASLSDDAAAGPRLELGRSWQEEAYRLHLSDRAWATQRIVGHQTAINHAALSNGTARQHPPARGRGRGGAHGRHVAQQEHVKDDAVEPFLRLDRDWLMLFVRDEVRVWHRSYLSRHLHWQLNEYGRASAPTGVHMEDTQVVRLPSREQASMSPMRRRLHGQADRASPFQHTSACCLLTDRRKEGAAPEFLVGRVDGSILHYRLPSGLSTKSDAARSSPSSARTTPWQAFAPTRLTFEAELLACLPTPPPPSQSSRSHSIQALSYSHGYLCSVTRTGTVALYRAEPSPSSRSWSLCWYFEMGRQAWTCHLDNASSTRGKPRWFAVGSKGSQALFVFPLVAAGDSSDADLVPVGPVSLIARATASDEYEPVGGPAAQRTRFLAAGERLPASGATAVFAVAQRGPTSASLILHPDTLAAGFYNGVVHIYDLRSALESETITRLTRLPLCTPTPLFPSSAAIDGDGRIPLESCPLLTPHTNLRDRFDISAIYSLAIGGGGGGAHIMAGTSTSGNIKIFDTRSNHSWVSPARPAPSEEDAASEDEDDADAVALRGKSALPLGTDDGWSVFAGYPARSPTFSLVAGPDFIVAATDRKLVDLVFTTVDLPRKNKDEVSSREGGDGDGVAFYTFDKMLLEHAVP